MLVFGSLSLLPLPTKLLKTIESRRRPGQVVKCGDVAPVGAEMADELVQLCESPRVVGLLLGSFLGRDLSRLGEAERQHNNEV